MDTITPDITIIDLPVGRGVDIDGERVVRVAPPGLPAGYFVAISSAAAGPVSWGKGAEVYGDTLEVTDIESIVDEAREAEGLAPFYADGGDEVDVPTEMDWVRAEVFGQARPE